MPARDVGENVRENVLLVKLDIIADGVSSRLLLKKVTYLNNIGRMGVAMNEASSTRCPPIPPF